MKSIDKKCSDRLFFCIIIITTVTIGLTYVRLTNRDIDQSPPDNTLISILGCFLLATIVYWARWNDRSEQNEGSYEIMIQQFGLTHDMLERLKLATLLIYLPLSLVLMVPYIILKDLVKLILDDSLILSLRHTTYEEAIQGVPDERVVFYLSGITRNEGANQMQLGLLGFFFTIGLLIFSYSLSAIKEVKNAETRKLVLGSRIIFFWALISSIPISFLKSSGIECDELDQGGWECWSVFNTKSLRMLHGVLLILNLVFIIGVTLVCQSHFFTYKNVKGKIPLSLFLVGFVLQKIIVLSSLLEMNTRTMSIDRGDVLDQAGSLYLIAGYPFLILFAIQFRKTLRMLCREFEVPNPNSDISKDSQFNT
ncbi:MAG: hypothetical protein ACXAD7_25425 [Candidatus Kariarchaeaceae archaeon]|jgi:hypothetical protein